MSPKKVSSVAPKTGLSNNRSTSKGKATDLERIRNNQRRCRARQKEYVSRLEDKIRQYVHSGTEGATNKRLEEFAAENKSLKQLLRSLGLGDEFLEAYRSAARIAPNISDSPLNDGCSAQTDDWPNTSFALDTLQLPPRIINHEDQSEHAVGSIQDVSVLKQASLDSTRNDASLSWEQFDFPAAPIHAEEAVEAAILVDDVGHSTLDSLMIKAFSNEVTVEDVSETTTLCSWAFSLVLKSNLKGYSVADLDLKLRVGYRHGATPTEGCRIDNKVLLNVLAEVM